MTPPGATIISAEVAPPPAFAPASLYFDYDSSELSPAARAVLQSFFDQAQKRPEQNILIEGNCDERGTREYNLALGQQRADAAKKYLAGLGLDAGRISAVSNGKERALATAGEPEAWSKDRRDDLIPVRSGAVLSAAIDDEW